MCIINSVLCTFLLCWNAHIIQESPRKIYNLEDILEMVTFSPPDHFPERGENVWKLFPQICLQNPQLVRKYPAFYSITEAD